MPKNKKQLNIRIKKELYVKIEHSEGKKSDIVTAALEQFFMLANDSKPATLLIANDSILLHNHIADLSAQIEKKDIQIEDLTRLVDQGQRIQMIQQRQFSNTPRKRWFEFWK